MNSVGAGVLELRVHDSRGEFRVAYIAKRTDAVYVLYAFQKKRRKTSSIDIALARARFATLTRYKM